MKKLVTLLLTAALAITAAATTAFAADTQITPAPNSSPNPSSGLMNVNYTVRPSYLVTIPETVTWNSANTQSTATVKAEKVTIPKGQAVQVKLMTDFTATYVEDTNAPKLTYQVANADSTKTFKNDDIVLTVESGSGSTDLAFAIVDVNKAKYSGTYIGTVTFEVSVKPTQTTNP